MGTIRMEDGEDEVKKAQVIEAGVRNISHSWVEYSPSPQGQYLVDLMW